MESSSTDPDTKKLEDEQLKEDYRVDYDWYKKDLRRFQENWVKAYALIWKSYCSKEVHVALGIRLVKLLLKSFKVY